MKHRASRFFIASAVLLSLGACRYPAYFRADVSADEQAADQKQCRIQADDDTDPIPNFFSFGKDEAFIYEDCMEVKGYTRQE